MKRTVLDSLNDGLLAAMLQDDSVLLLARIFSTLRRRLQSHRGISTAFPERVITTPISEAGLGGICAGLALRGCAGARDHVWRFHYPAGRPDHQPYFQVLLDV